MTRYRGRRAASIENGTLRVTVLEEGGHIAEICDLATGVNPLWTPHWPSVEPSEYDAARHSEYGGAADASLLAGIMGHNLCLDFFGGPSDDEAAAGLPAHGEASIARWEIDAAADAIAMTARLPVAGLRVARWIRIDGRTVHVRERLENLSQIDRPIGWTQHVTLGPPFLDNGATQLHVTADRSLVFPGQFGPADYLQPGAEFSWPHAPRIGGGLADLRTYSGAPASSAYTAHRLDPRREDAGFVAFSPAARLAFGYVWRTADWACGKKTGRGRWRRGTASSGPAASSSACRPCRKPGGR